MYRCRHILPVETFFRSYNVIAWSEIQEVIVQKYILMNFGYHVPKNMAKCIIQMDARATDIAGNLAKVFIGSQRIAALESAIGEFKEVSVQLK